MRYLVAMDFIDTTIDISQAEHWIRSLAPEVRQRECGWRILLDAILEGTFVLRRRDDLSYEMFVPFRSVKEGSPDRLIVEVESHKDGYIIRRKT
jgi:hypothetical protein